MARKPKSKTTGAPSQSAGRRAVHALSPKDKSRLTKFGVDADTIHDLEATVSFGRDFLDGKFSQPAEIRSAIERLRSPLQKLRSALGSLPEAAVDFLEMVHVRAWKRRMGQMRAAGADTSAMEQGLLSEMAGRVSITDIRKRLNWLQSAVDLPAGLPDQRGTATAALVVSRMVASTMEAAGFNRRGRAAGYARRAVLEALGIAQTPK